jgi:hypothetical protein
MNTCHPRRPKRKGVWLLLASSVCALGCSESAAPKISDQDMKALQRLAADLMQRKENASKQRRAALRAAWASVKPDPSGPKCAVKLAPVDSTEFQVHSCIIEARMLSESYDPAQDEPPPAESRRLLKPRQRFGEPKPATMMSAVRARVAREGPRAHVVGNMLSGIERLIAQGHWDGAGKRDSTMAFYSDVEQRFDYELAIVAEENLRPEHNGSVFVSGRVRGRAFLYSYEDDRVLCTADVNATNADQHVVKIDPNDHNVRGHQTLEDDLDRRAFQQAVDGLVAVTPIE